MIANKIDRIEKHERNNSSNIKRIFNQDFSPFPVPFKIEYTTQDTSINHRTSPKRSRSPLNKSPNNRSIIQDPNPLPTLNLENKKIFNLFNHNNTMNKQAVKLLNTNSPNKTNIKNLELYPITNEMKIKKDPYNIEISDINPNKSPKNSNLNNNKLFTKLATKLGMPVTPTRLKVKKEKVVMRPIKTNY